MSSARRSIRSYVASETTKRARPLLIASTAFLSIGGFAATFALQVRSDRNLVASIAPHLASLLAIGDTVEANRLLSSIAEKQSSELFAVKNERIAATSRALSNLNAPAPESVPVWIRLGAVALGPGGITSYEKQLLPDGSKEAVDIVLTAPYRLVALPSFFFTAFVAGLTYAIGFAVIRAASHSARDAMSPVQSLSEAIEALVNEGRLEALQSVAIEELEVIRTAVMGTYQEWMRSKDALASAKARAIVGDVFGAVLHDLGGLSLVMKRVSSRLSDVETTPEQQQEAIELARRTSSNIVRTIESGRRLLEISAPQMVFAPVQESIEASIQSITSLDSTVSVKLDLPKDPIFIEHDPTLFQRALTNLVQNAAKFAATQVRVGLVSSDDSLMVAVSDDGPGIDPGEVAKYLKGKGGSSNGDRPAFGLLSAQYIARAHGARLVYRKNEPKGSTFEIRMPRKESA